MANKPEAHAGSPPFMGKEHAQAMLEIQKEVLKAYEEAGRARIERVKSEFALWSGASRAMPDGLQAWQDTFAHRMQMVADDGRHLFEDGEKIIASISHTMLNGWQKKSS